MHPRRDWIAPQLNRIDPTAPDERWREHLPKVRELAQQALDLAEETAPPETVAKLRNLIELIDAEMA